MHKCLPKETTSAIGFLVSYMNYVSYILHSLIWNHMRNKIDFLIYLEVDKNLIIIFVYLIYLLLKVHVSSFFPLRNEVEHFFWRYSWYGWLFWYGHCLCQLSYIINIFYEIMTWSYSLQVLYLKGITNSRHFVKIIVSAKAYSSKYFDFSNLL